MDKAVEHKKYMQRCLDLAAQGLGTTYPNPLVGSVIVYNGKIISEGYHYKSGEPHAEVLAIRSVKDKTLLKQSALYVNLEPCSHYGKTPPCADLIVNTGIPEVIIGTIDTSDKVHGRGIQRLRNGGCKVTTGILEKECRQINRRFFTFHEKKRPYIILKWAQSADGFLDEEREEGQKRPDWISGPLGRQLVHKWRSEEQAILVGRKTALIDNPSLTVRDWYGENPLRLVIDRELTLPSSLHLSDDEAPTIVFNAIKEKHNTQPELVSLDFSRPIEKQILDFLYERDIQSLIIEGGAYTLEHFINNTYWDEARVFYGNRFFHAGIKAPALKRQPVHAIDLADSHYSLFYRSQTF